MWCLPESIGTDANIATVQAVTNLLVSHQLEFYGGLSSWYVPSVASLRPDDKTQIYLARSVMRLDNLTGYYDSRMMFGIDLSDVELVGSSEALYNRHGRDYIAYKVTGVTGLAELSELSVGDAVNVGDSIIRADEELIVTELPFQLEAGDRLASPPDDLRLAAEGIGKRLLKLRLDRKADWDNAKPENALLDGWRDLIRSYQTENLSVH